MNLCLYIITTIFSFILIQSSIEEPLLKMSHNSYCLKQVIDDFIKKQTCQKLKESQKSMLAIKMTNCLNTQMGKAIIPECGDLKDCKIQGDNWNTFTSFLTHIDNLCHFYWDLLHHERTESLIDGLSKSAFLAEDILRKNYQQTKQILLTQTQIQTFMERSLVSNQKLSDSLTQSEQKLQNMTQGIQKFLNQLNENILSHYSYLVKAMTTINQGMESFSTVHSFMISEISSMSGILYFLVHGLILLFLTSFKYFKNNRTQSFIIFLANILLEVGLPNWMLLCVGIKNTRIIFFIGHFFNLIKAFLNKSNKIEEFKNQIDGRLSTRRIKRIFKEIINEAKFSLPQKTE